MSQISVRYIWVHLISLVDHTEMIMDNLEPPQDSNNISNTFSCSSTGCWMTSPQQVQSRKESFKHWPCFTEIPVSHSFAICPFLGGVWGLKWWSYICFWWCLREWFGTHPVWYTFLCATCSVIMASGVRLRKAVRLWQALCTIPLSYCRLLLSGW